MFQKNKKISLLVPCLLVFICILSATSAGQALSSEIDPTNSSDYLDYGKGHYFTLTVINLDIGTNYTIEVGNNTIHPYNLSFIATAFTAEISITWTDIQVDLYNNTLNQLEIVFFTENVALQTYYISMRYDNTIPSLVSTVLTYLWEAILIFLSGFIALVIVKFIFR